jgi:CHAD domain-containing protein
MGAAGGHRMPTTLTHPELSADGAIDALRAAGFEVDLPRPSERGLLDTFDGRVHRGGLRLEARAGEEAALVLLSIDDAPPARLEWDGGTPQRPADLPPGPFRARLAELTEERALLPLATVTSTVREARRTDRRGKIVARAELHEQLTVDHAALDGWLLELSGVAGHDDVDRVVARLTALGMHPVGDDVTSAAATAAGLDVSGRVSSPTVPLDRDEPALAGLRRVLANLAVTIEDNLEGTIDDIDPEFLHELRVAVRRTRSVLAEAKGVLPADVRAHHRDGFGWLGEVTGPARDLDVYVLGWERYVAPLQSDGRDSLDRVREELDQRRLAAHEELSRALCSERCCELLDGWERWLHDPDVTPPDEQRLGRFVARRVAKAQRKVLEHGRSITPDSPAERLHDLRKDTKKLRYLLECFGSLFPAKGRRAFVDQLKALQDNLGEHQDAEVHLAQLRALAHDLNERATVDTDALLAMGRLSDHLDRRRAEERAGFVERFAAYDTKANRRLLDKLLHEVASG